MTRCLQPNGSSRDREYQFAPMDVAIRKRAVVVGRLGEWVGLFDLLVYAAATQQQLSIWFGDELVDVLGMFLPDLRAEWPAGRPVLHLIATKLSDTSRPVGDVRDMNHWLGATPIDDAVVVHDVEGHRSLTRADVGGKAKALAAKRRESKSDLEVEEIVAYYMERGFAAHKTVAQGDCGIDAICISEGRVRSPLSWQQTRTKIMESMWERASSKLWQDLWSMCGENVHPKIDEEVSDGDESSPPHESAEEFAEEFSGVLGVLSPKTAHELVQSLCPERAEALRLDLSIARNKAKAMCGFASPLSRYGQQVRCSLQVRLALGVAFNEYKKKALENNDGKRVAFVKDFCQQNLRVAWTPVVKKRVLDAGKLAAKYGSTWQGQRPQGHPVFKRTAATADARKNRVSTQGAPHKALPVREALFQWFVDIRGAVAGRLPHKIVLAQARLLLDKYVSSSLEHGHAPRVPKLNSCWLNRWRTTYGVSFRKPNRRYKMSRKGILQRLEIFWLNNVRVRHFASRMLGVDPGSHVDNADQKGWFMNHQGSKLHGTLALGAGSPDIPVKENHAATRTRVSFMTYTSNNADKVRRGLPLELCFRAEGSGERILDGLRVPPPPPVFDQGRLRPRPGAAVSVRCSESGSYKEEHVYVYLETHLEPATPERLEAKDWRLFYLDIYSGHLSYRIWQLCWSRMYVLLFHGGGCTGLTQPNDLWLHWDFERKLCDLEAQAFLRHGLLRPHKIPTLSRQELLDMAASTWFNDIDHRRSVKWTAMAGMSLALDGSQEPPSVQCVQYVRVRKQCSLCCMLSSAPASNWVLAGLCPVLLHSVAMPPLGLLSTAQLVAVQ